MKRVGIIAARSKAEARELGLHVADWLVERGVEPVVEEGLLAGEPADAVVVLGGDGLMMRAANMLPDMPLLGINFGKVGFLALVEQADWQRALEALLGGAYRIQDGATLEAVVVRGSEQIEQGWAINDVVVRGGTRMVDIEVYIDGHYVNTFPGDGMIASTPHGSTAYCMAAGGPILTAGVRGFAVLPISCRAPIRMPFVVPEEALIELILANDRDATLILDGRETGALRLGDVVDVRRGKHLFRLVTLDSTNFYEAFRTKFNYKIRPDAVPSRPAAGDQSAPVPAA